MNHSLKRAERARQNFLQSEDPAARLKLEKTIRFYCKSYFLIGSGEKAKGLLEAGTSTNGRIGGLNALKKDALAEINEKIALRFQAFAAGARRLHSNIGASLDAAIGAFWLGVGFVAFALGERGFVMDVCYAGAISMWSTKLDFGASSENTGYFKNASNLVAPALSFLICAASELMQKYGILPGTYDPKDFLAFTVGAAVTYAVGNPLVQAIRRMVDKSETGQIAQ